VDIDSGGGVGDDGRVTATFPSRRLTWRLMVLAGIPLVLGSLALAPWTGRHDLGGLAWYVPGIAVYAAGGVAFRACPENVVGRRLLVFGVVTVLFNLSQNLLLYALFDHGPPGWWFGPANVVQQMLGLSLGVFLLATLAVYPDGIYQRRYERRLVYGAAALVVVVPLLALLARSTLMPAAIFEWISGSRAAADELFPAIASPIHVAALAFLDAPVRFFLSIAFTAIPFWAGVVLALRYRRLRAERRLQLRWPMYAGVATIVTGIEGLVWQVADIPYAVSIVTEIGALIIVAASLVIGLVKPDLFDIDRAMRRSLVYVPLWIAIAGAYIGVAALLGMAASGAGLPIAIGVTIVATVLFEPARRALVARAGRWAFGESLSGEELVRRLGATLEHTLDSEQLTAAIVTIAREGLGVRWARIECDDGVAVTDGEPPRDGERPVLSAPLVHAGQPLGEISCGPRVRGRAQASDRELFATLARQAALALHNARLAGELGRSLEALRAQADELAASRARIVAAQEAARRQIERDIHDGAQQELVALIARIGLARSQLTRHPDRLGETLGDLQVEARQALENLRQLASGIHPAVLSDHGIVEAIESRAARFPLGVTIECDPRMRAARFAEAVEGAAYFFVCEGFANALKHARAERVRVRLSRTAGALAVEVSDDGGGFDVGATARSGLAGLADRREAIGGRLEVDSTTGRGTTLTARLPIDEAVVV
jgi:signal transduction histidine kinase